MEYIIINYRPNNTNISSAEYIKKTKYNLNINKTHGIGSGIYGLIPYHPNYLSQVINRKYEIRRKIILNNPYIIYNDIQLSKFCELSIWLIKQCENIINDNIDNIYETNIIKQINIELFNDIDLKYIIYNFVNDYKKAEIGDFIKQPINYLLEPFYDGIYNNCNNGNLFSVGSVKFKDINIRHQKGCFDIEGYFMNINNKLIYDNNKIV